MKTKNKTLCVMLIAMISANSSLAYSANINSFAPPAAAQITAPIVTAVNAVNSSVSAMNANLAQAFTQLGLNLDGVGGKVAEAVGQASSNAVDRAVDMEKTKKAIEAGQNTRTPIDPCANAARGLGDMKASLINPNYSWGGSSQRGDSRSPGQASTKSASMDRAIDVAKGTVSIPSPETQTNMGFLGACESYASGQRAKNCIDSGIRPESKSHLPNADVDANTLFSGAQTAADKGKLSMQFNADQIAAADAYIKNLSAPVQLRSLTPAEASTDVGHMFYALKDVFLAKSDLATYPAESWKAGRIADKGTIPVMQAMLDGKGAAAQYLTKILPLQAPKWQTEGVSHHLMTMIENSRRVDNADWFKEIAVQSDALTLQREQLMLLAQINDVLVKQSFETKQSNVLLGAMYMAQVNRDLMPELTAAHRKALSSRK